MDGLRSVVRARYRGEYRIHVTLDDDSARTIDFRPWLKGPVFEPLKNIAYFRRFFVDGDTVAWPNGADIAPETLYAAVTAQRTKSAPPGGSRKRRSAKRSTTAKK